MWPSPGWYPSDEKKGRERWFDGNDWTSRTRPVGRRQTRTPLSPAQQRLNDSGFLLGIVLIALGVTALFMGWTIWALPSFGVGFMATVTCGNQLKRSTAESGAGHAVNGRGASS